MADKRALAERHLPVLRDWLSRLGAYGERQLYGIRFSDADHLAFMALSFAARLFDHAKALLALGANRDAELIARSMLEGMVYLKWAAQEPSVRPGNWRDFVAVENWRYVKDLDEAGIPVDAEEKKMAGEQVLATGDRFYTKRARNAAERGDALPEDPYQGNWTGLKVRDVFEAVKGEQMYRMAYAFFSDWHHWNPIGLIRALETSEDTFEFTAVTALDLAGAYSTANQALFETLDVALRHLRPSAVPELERLRSEYLADYDRLGRVSP